MFSYLDASGVVLSGPSIHGHGCPTDGKGQKEEEEAASKIGPSSADGFPERKRQDGPRNLMAVQHQEPFGVMMNVLQR